MVCAVAEKVGLGQREKPLSPAATLLNPVAGTQGVTGTENPDTHCSCFLACSVQIHGLLLADGCDMHGLLELKRQLAHLLVDHHESLVLPYLLLQLLI
jgi:hypothetical protein